MIRVSFWGDHLSSKVLGSARKTRRMWAKIRGEMTLQTDCLKLEKIRSSYLGDGIGTPGDGGREAGLTESGMEDNELSLSLIVEKLNFLLI